MTLAHDESLDRPLRLGRRPAVPVGAKPLVIVAAVTLFYVILNGIYTAAYMVNDDLVMASIASGDYTGNPDSGLVFIGPAWAHAIAILYGRFGGYPWYALTLYSVQILSLSAILSTMWVRRHSIYWPAAAMSFLSFLVFVPLIALLPTFTSTALLAGVALVITVIGFGALQWRSWFGVAVSVLVAALAVASASLRWESFLGALALGVPLLLLGGMGMQRANLIRALVIISGVVLVVSVGSAFGIRGEGWNKFDGFNEVRGQLHGNSSLEGVVNSPDDPAVTAMLQENDWVVDDIYMFGAWFYDDDSTYDEEKLGRLLNVSGETRALSISEGWSTLASGRSWLLAFIVGCAIAGLAGSSNLAVFLNSAQLLWSAAIMTYVAMTQRFPDRLAHPVLLGVSLFVALGPSFLPANVNRSSFRRPSLRRTGLGVISVAVTLVMVVAPIRSRYAPSVVSTFNDGRIAALDAQVEALKRIDSDGRFVYVGDALEVEGVSPWRAGDPFLTKQVLGLGWPTFSPPFEKRKRNLGIEGDLMLSIAKQDDVYLVLRPGIVGLAEQTYERRLGLGLAVRSVGTLPNGAEVYSIRLRSE